MKMMKLSDYVIDFLVAKRLTCIFEVCGGSITHLLDSLYKRRDISDIGMHHEQSAAFAAEGYARASGTVGVAMATSGPGATNLITGIGSAFFDNVPCVFITGQVNTYEFKFDKPVRQAGFQETDIVKIIAPLVKEAILVKDASAIKYSLEKAFFLAKSGRPGPVLLDIPMNIQRAMITPQSLKAFKAPKRDNPLDGRIIQKIVHALDKSSRPVILAGGGVRTANAVKELSKFVRTAGIPVVTSLMGLDSLAHDEDCFVGMIGTYGNRYANLALANADFVLALGTRLDTRQTGTRPETFVRAGTVVHVDIDPSELNHKVKADFGVKACVKDFLIALNSAFREKNTQRFLPWMEKIRLYKDAYPSYRRMAQDKDIDPNLFVHTLSRLSPSDAIICSDVGQNQMWAAQSFSLKGSQRFLTQGGMAAMGSSLSLAIGASFAKPGKTIIVITGDGGFQLNIQELQTLFHYKLPIKIVLLNNYCYGMVRQFQQQYFSSRFQSTVIGYSCPDFRKVVGAYKIKAAKISHCREMKSAVKNLFIDKKPRFLEVDIQSNRLVSPKLALNMPLEDQEPYLSEKEFNSNMLIKPLRERSG